ncbi:MAG: PqqD family protein [Chloroflexi bacterium]|nr:PqqD family protein [Chloroflexota bacterium]
MADRFDLLNAYVRRNPGLAARRIGDETVIVQADRSSLHLLTNDVASRIWQLADGRTTARAIGARLSEEYDAPSDEIMHDVADFLAQLASLGLVTLECQAAEG